MSAAEARRRFFRSLFAEAAGFAEEIRGRPRFRLEDLPSLPAAALDAIRPRLVEGARLDGARLTGPEGAFVDLDAFASWAAARFDGTRSLAAVADEAVTAFPADAERCRAWTRAVFLGLASRVLCVPTDAKEETAARAGHGPDGAAMQNEGGER